MSDKRIYNGLELRNYDDEQYVCFKDIGTIPHITDIINSYNAILEENKELKQFKSNIVEFIEKERIVSEEEYNHVDTAMYNAREDLLDDLKKMIKGGFIMNENRNLPVDRNGYNKIICPLCNSDLEESRQVAYPNGVVYYEFDCVKCDYTGRIRKGNLYD